MTSIYQSFQVFELTLPNTIQPSPPPPLTLKVPPSLGQPETQPPTSSYSQAPTLGLLVIDGVVELHPIPAPKPML